MPVGQDTFFIHHVGSFAVVNLTGVSDGCWEFVGGLWQVAGYP